MAPKKKGKPDKAALAAAAEAEAQRLREEEEARAKAEVERLEEEKEEETRITARIARQDAEQNALEEEERIAREEEELLAKDEVDRLARREEERVAKEEAKLKAIADAVAKAAFEADFELRGRLLREGKREKDVEHEKRGLEMKKTHQVNLQKIEADRVRQLKQFEADAKQSLDICDTHAEQKLSDFARDQNKEHAEYLVKIRSEAEPVSPKWSPETLRHREILRHFITLKDFDNATKHRALAEDLEKADEKRWLENREETIQVVAESHARQQAQAMVALEYRFELERKKIVSEQQVQRKQVELRFTTLQQQCEAQHAVKMRQHNLYMGDSLRLASKL